MASLITSFWTSLFGDRFQMADLGKGSIMNQGCPNELRELEIRDKIS